jgi:hypothetical protein
MFRDEIGYFVEERRLSGSLLRPSRTNVKGSKII